MSKTLSQPEAENSSRFRFEYEYTQAERKRYDKLNAGSAVGPSLFALVWCLCFLPTVLCLLWLQLWSVASTVVVFVLVASFVPAIVNFRTRKFEHLRTTELNPVGRVESVGASRGLQKWDSVDEVIETKSDFLFSRHQRFSLLPKRVVPEDQIDMLREQVTAWRNRPKDSNIPVEMYRNIFQGEGSSPTWEMLLTRDDLVAAAKSNSIRVVNEGTFSFKDIETVDKSSRWVTWLTMGVLFKLALVLIFASLPPNRLDWASLACFVCLNPLVLLVAMGWWIRRRGYRSIPRFNSEHYKLRLLDGGWAIGTEDVVNFNGWTERTAFYLGKECIGIRSDFAVIHVLPSRNFSGPDGKWQFLNQAIRLKNAWLSRKTNPQPDVQEAVVVDNETESVDGVNPYRSPAVNDR